MMDKQIHVYSVDDKAFFKVKEQELNNNLAWAKSEKKLIEEFTLYNIISQNQKVKYDIKKLSEFKNRRKSKWVGKYIQKLLKDNNSKYKTELKQSLIANALYRWVICCYISLINRSLNEIIENNKMVRSLNPKCLKQSNTISSFESDLSRTLNLESNQLALDLFVVRIYRYAIMEQLIKNGFTYLNERYVPLTASAGQIRTKKIVFIKEKTKDEFNNTLMCGLTIEDINNSSEQGMSINKFLSYLALVNSATDEIKDFDIDRAIVIDDFQTEVEGTVDFIDKKLMTETKKVKNENEEEKEVTEEYWLLADKPIKQLMKVPITHSDGCGWVLPSKFKKSFMLRLPWIKGLLTPANYLAYCKDFNNGDYTIKDIYGKIWDLKEDKIEYVFSKSQFKMWKYYPNILGENGEVIKYGWDTYKDNFKLHHCHANYCNEEPEEFENKRFNYQMLQTLTDIESEEINELIQPTEDFIKKAYSDKDTMLELLGADKSNKRKSYLQQALEIYPELINDHHVKEELSDIINSRRKEAAYGKIRLDCTYTYLLPDVFAWMEFAISDTKEPKGLLENNQVFCRLYKDKKELLVERSPHLFREHAVRDNVIDDVIDNVKKKDWFCSDGVYTSSHDLISKVLQFDNDGDKALIVADSTAINVARRNMEGIYPIYYEMGVAAPQKINNENIYESLKMAFKYGNIGEYSNKLTKLWNTEGEKDLDLLDLMKILCALNNFSIDAAKTLTMPRISKEISDKIKAINKLKLPYFFQFAKDKDPDKLAEINNSTVNQICKKIEDIKIPVKKGTKNEKYNFTAIGKFRSAMLMKNPKIEINDKVIAKYKELNKDKNEYFFQADLPKNEIAIAVYESIRFEFEANCWELGVDIVDAVDMVIKYIYKNNPTCKKSFLFNCFGNIIVENLKNNIKKPLGKGYIQCKCCGKRVKKTSNRQRMCQVCREKKIQERDRARKAKK